MIEIRQTREFQDWYEKLKDVTAVKRIAQRMVRIESGLLVIRNILEKLVKFASIQAPDTEFIL